MDGSAADVAKNPGRHAPQRTSATGEIAVSLPINLVALVKAHRPQCRVLESGAPNSAETVFETITPTKDHTVGAMFRPNAQPAIDCATPESIFALCTLCRGCLHSSPDRSCNTARLAEGPNKSSWAAPKYPTVNSQKPKPCGPKLELPTSFTLVRRIGARVDGTLQICVSDGTFDAVPNVRVRPVSTTGKRTRQST